MSHIDDGRLNALLDGELDTAETAEVRAHIAGCAECAKRLEEAMQFLAGASDLLGVLDLPATVNVPATPPRRVSKTAKEVAIDIDGATHKSPAIRPNLPEPAAARPTGWPRIDFTTLGWAAMVVLAIGVGYLANEVRHTRSGMTGEARVGEGGLAAPVATPGQAAAPPTRADRTSHGTAKSAAPTRITSTAQTRPTHRAPGATSLAGKPAAPSAGKRLATGNAPAAHRRPTRGAASTDLAAAAGAAGARAQEGAPSRQAPAPSAALAAGNSQAIVVTGVTEPARVLATFRRTTLEEAVARLGGVIRLMDGMRFEQVEVGPGRLVPGADGNRDLVRLLYFDTAGRRLELDQQRVMLPVDGGRVSPDIGMHPGDTLTTAASGGEVRVRWIDGTFWLSLTGNLPPAELRRLIERVR